VGKLRNVNKYARVPGATAPLALFDERVELNHPAPRTCIIGFAAKHPTRNVSKNGLKCRLQKRMHKNEVVTNTR
jgi:hypothetical protein